LNIGSQEKSQGRIPYDVLDYKLPFIYNIRLSFVEGLQPKGDGLKYEYFPHAEPQLFV